jgi:SAM-dependent methyltransferase
MVEHAHEMTEEPNVEFRHGFSHETGLEAGLADIVTCSQSLHWMEPAPTFAEAARILRPGGVFAAYDYDIFPTVDWELDQALLEYGGRRGDLRRRRDVTVGADRWSKVGHLDRIRESGEFRFCRELVLQSVEDGDAERIVGLLRSIGMIGGEDVDAELRLDEVEAVARLVLGDRTVPFRFGYHVRVGVR